MTYLFCARFIRKVILISSLFFTQWVNAQTNLSDGLMLYLNGTPSEQLDTYWLPDGAGLTRDLSSNNYQLNYGEYGSSTGNHYQEGGTFTSDKFGNKDHAYSSPVRDVNSLASDLQNHAEGAISLWFKPSSVSTSAENNYLVSINSSFDWSYQPYEQLAIKAGEYFDPNIENPTEGDLKEGVEVFLKQSYDNLKSWIQLQEIINYKNEWHHLILNSNGATVSLRVDDQDPVMIASSSKWVDDFSNLTTFSVGGQFSTHYYNRTPDQAFFDDAYDEVRVYNRSLTNDEMDALYSPQNPSFDGWLSQDNMTYMNTDYSLGIGTNDVDKKLTVNGTVLSEEVNVATDITSVPDYVFEKDYPLMELEELEKFIQTESHLPKVPSASQIGKEGLDLEQMNLLLLEKIEELTLYTLEQEEKISSQQKKYQVLLSSLIDYQEKLGDFLRLKE